MPALENRLMATIDTSSAVFKDTIISDGFLFFVFVRQRRHVTPDELYLVCRNHLQDNAPLDDLRQCLAQYTLAIFQRLQNRKMVFVSYW